MTLWGGFSLRWYASLLARTSKLLERALLSLRIAAVSATVATALGALVALALQRAAQAARARCCSSGMITAPLVMPEIITGLSLLFLFISMAELDRLARDARRDDDHDRATSRSRWPTSPSSCARGSPGWTSRSRKRAMDLGGRPLAVFFDVTVPMLLPALRVGLAAVRSRCRSTTS